MTKTANMVVKVALSEKAMVAEKEGRIKGVRYIFWISGATVLISY